ncbi:hypothetical protein QFC20_004932 [Naganishia adeliensis]|uniref:Uncharacterized protein n=1 Tax=Naganishia adeliensis TaxID=92952 RepID=A0ACC2VVE9_9TREE|nr:hypothetical protein QFC20_004932 [Naganishia adeliensis]
MSYNTWQIDTQSLGSTSQQPTSRNPSFGTNSVGMIMTAGIEEAACQEHPGIIFGSKCVKIEANGEFLLHRRQLKDRFGLVESSNPNYNADLGALRELFGLSVTGSSKGHQTFENHLRAKYNAAVTFHCANTLGKHITEISWKGGSPQAQEIEACLDTYPGTVHIWAHIEDMQALFFAREGFFLSEKGRAFGGTRWRPTFDQKLRAKYRMAVNAAYAWASGTEPEEIRWDPGNPDKLRFQEWLEHNPGTVHVFVDEKDMHAEFRPAQAGLFCKSQF